MQKWLGFTAVVALLIIAGCILPNPSQQQTAGAGGATPTSEPTAVFTPDETHIGCAGYPSLMLRDECYSREALLKDDPHVCEAVINYSMRDICYRAFASSRLNESYCAIMKLPENRRACYFDIARAKNDSSICAMIDENSTRRECRVELKDPLLLCENETTESAHAICMAKATGDYQHCISLENLSESDTCLYELGNESLQPEVCGKIVDSSLRGECYIAIAKQKEDALICALIEDDGTHDACVHLFMAKPTREVCALLRNNDSVYSCLARAEMSPQMCTLVHDYLVKDSCYEEYAEYARDSFYCSLISTTLYKNRCYENLSVTMNNTNLCSNVVPELERDGCYLKNARANVNMDACLQIKLESFQLPCITEIATYVDNPSLCNIIEQSYYRDRCYSMIISKGTYSYALCSNITAGLWHDECYMRAAIRENSESLCAKLIYESARSECYRRFGKQ